MEINIKNTAGYLRKVSISVSPAAAVLCVGLVLCGSYMPLAAAFLHELGHLCAMLLTGTRIERITLSLPGADIGYSGCRSYGAEFVCALAGGVFNIIGALVGALMYLRYGCTVFIGFAASCIGLAALNLLPALPLDGGIALRALLCLFADCDTACAVMRVVSKSVAVCIAVFAAYLLFYGIGGALAIPMCALCVICWNGEKE